VVKKLLEPESAVGVGDRPKVKDVPNHSNHVMPGAEGMPDHSGHAMPEMRE
jgi:hypothetical protein